MDLDWQDLGLTFGGDLLSAYSQRQQQQKRQEMLNTAHQFGLAQAAKGRASIDQYLARFTPEARAQQVADSRAEVAGNIDKGMGAVAPFTANADFAGKISPDYARVKADANASTQERVKKAMANLAVMGAPAAAAPAQRAALNDAGTDVAISNQAAAKAREFYTGAIDEVRPNSLTFQIGQAMRGLGLGAADAKRKKKHTPYDMEEAPGQFSTVNTQYG